MLKITVIISICQCQRQSVIVKKTRIGLVRKSVEWHTSPRQKINDTLYALEKKDNTDTATERHRS